jgi:hypothetical protein
MIPVDMHVVWDQWGRFIWWAGQNAGAIQALSGVGILLLTGAITYVTWKYVQLTSTIVNLTRSQLEHDLLPKVAFPKFDIDASSLVAHATIRNAGSRPFRIISIGVACFDGKAKQPLYPRMELSENGTLSSLQAPTSPSMRDSGSSSNSARQSARTRQK